MGTPSLQVFNIPSVTVFARHSVDCSHRGDERWKRCNCPKHLRWSYGGKQYRRSAKTRSWQIAEQRRRDVEDTIKRANTAPQSDGEEQTEAAQAGDVRLETKSQPTLAKAVELFLSDKASQGLDADFRGKYERELGRLVEFMESRSILFPQQMTLASLTEFRAGWEQWYKSSTTRSKVQERLRSFLRYCYNARLIDRIPQLSPIRIDEAPTMPLTDKEYSRLLKAVKKSLTGDWAVKTHALIQLMRWSGLAIQDAVTLEQAELKATRDGRYQIETSRQKTGTHVSVPIQPDVAKELIEAMKLSVNPRYVFWTGNGKVKTVLSNWGNRLRELFRAAGMADGHPHQLRDTFAVDLLAKGVPLEDVSKLLGHDSIKTTEKHYAKWVKARQDRLDSLVIGTWA